MAMGIDQEIQRRMDAYRGNPQALQQRYQMNQQLLDLLALQKLKSEKDAVARQMQAQMQQMPGTVAQQREQELLGRTKQEMAQQVGGVMQQQARQQQQNMARMAQAMARPQGGIAGLAPQGARPAPRMAGGGVVAFAQGGGPLGAIDEELAQLQAELRGLGPYSSIGMVPPGSEEKYARIEELENQIRALERRRGLAERMAAGEPLSPVGGGVGALAGARRAREEDIAAIRGMTTPVAAATTPTAPPAPAGPPGDGKGPLLDAPPYLPSGRSTATEALRSVGRAGTQNEIVAIEPEPEPKLELNRVTAPQVDEAPSAAGLRSLLQAQAEEAAPDMTKLMEQYGSALGQKERMERRQARIDELAALDRAQLDPERARKDRLLRTMAAAGGASNIGTMGARMANAAVNARINQEQDERARLRQRLAMADEMDVADLDISKESLKNALGTIDNAKARRIQAMNALGTLSQAEIARLEANAKLEAEADRENNTSAYREYEAATQRAKAVLARQDAGVDQLTAVAKQMLEAYKTKYEQLMTQLQSDARYIELVNDAERTEAEERERLEMIAEVERGAAAYANTKDYFAIMKQLNDRALQNAGISLNSGR